MRPIDESAPRTIDNLESEELWVCPGCGALLLHSEENPEAMCPECKLEGPPARAADLVERWNSAARLAKQVRDLREALGALLDGYKTQRDHGGGMPMWILNHCENALEATKEEG